MKPKTLTSLVGLSLVAAAVGGCSLVRPDSNNPDSLLPKLGFGSGTVVEPKRCTLTVTIVSKPLHEKVVNDSVWSTSDEQVVDSATRMALHANGLRIGVIEGSLPKDLETVLNAPPPNKIDPAEFNIPEGSNTLLALAEATPEVTILLARDGRPFGKDYKEATGWFRVTASHAGATGVELRFVPEIHHGPVVRRYDATKGTAASINQMEFTLKDGQQEETLRDLAATLTLEPGQTAILGSDPDRPGSLGAFLFTHAEANSDRLMQKLVIVRASRSNLGIPGSQPKPKSRLFPVEPPSELPPLPTARNRNDRPS
jgi:hypothetical protein